MEWLPDSQMSATGADGGNYPTLVLDVHAELGEGPVWDTASQALIWVDILAPTVHWYYPSDGRTSSLQMKKPVGAIAVRSSGGLVLALEDGFWLLDQDDNSLRHVGTIEADNASIRMNDGKCDSSGRFWAGTVAYDSRPQAAALYRLETDLRVTKVLSDVTISNGLAWSPDDRTLYFIDSPTQGVDAFDYDARTGDISRRRRLLEVHSEVGLPDGMTVDEDGFLWVALWRGRAVHRYAPDGTLDRVVRLPVSQVTSCAFGGHDLRDLYITSAAVGLGAEAIALEPHAGGLFRFRPGVAGIPARTFDG